MGSIGSAIIGLEKWAESLDKIIIGELEEEIFNDSNERVSVYSLFRGLYGYSFESAQVHENPRGYAYMSINNKIRVIGVIFPFKKKAYCIKDKGDRLIPIEEEEEKKIDHVHESITIILERRGYSVFHKEWRPMNYVEFLDEPVESR